MQYMWGEFKPQRAVLPSALTNPSICSFTLVCAGDGHCDVQCNNRQCGHNDCTPKQIMDKCWAEQQVSGDDLTTEPTSADVAALVTLDRVSLAIDEDLNEVIGTWAFSYTLQWQDPRLLTSPCALALDNLLSIAPEEAKSEADIKQKRERQKYFWLPQPVFGLAQENVFQSGAFAVSPTPGSVNTTGQEPLHGLFEACNSTSPCVSYTAEHKLRIKQSFE